MKSYKLSGVVGLFVFSAVPFAPAATIPGLFNTGVNAAGVPLAAGAVDSHYRLVRSPDATVPGPNTFVVLDGFPIPPWLAQGPNSKWIGPQASQGVGNLPGDYIYRLSFDLTGLDPESAVITVRWSSDNLGNDILLNGVRTGITGDGNFGAWSPYFQITSAQAAFLPGSNALDFVVNNAGDAANPTGVRAEVSGTAPVLPPPNTPVSITTPPPNATAATGDSASFRVVATGGRPLFYQWLRDGTPIPGATNQTFAIGTVALSDAGSYRVIVSNAVSTVTSAVATLTVIIVNPTPAQLTYERPGPSSRRTGLAISEIMYHPGPRADARELEFIELYNSNPFAEDVSGWQLAGNIAFTFPANTSIPANGYVVIAAAPADLQAVYGLANTFGPYTGKLPNDSGTIQLRKRSGGLILDVTYSDQPPWPVAADGAGHSLVLARPSYGERDPRTWAASGLRGGSPGGPDPVPTNGLEHVVINEILAHTDVALRDFIELYNHSAFPVDVSGCWLSDDPTTNKFRIPDGTLLPAGGFLSFEETQLGFALAANGETAFFVNSNQTRVVDAVRFGGQANGVSWSRTSDGAAQFSPSAESTPGTNNAPARLADVVINEIMYHPPSGLDDDQFIELYNRGATPAVVGGWQLLGGVSFTFPNGTTIPNGGYLVVANNATRLRTNYAGLNAVNTLGNFGGNLSRSGERVALARPDFVTITNGNVITTNVAFYVVVDEVTYRDGGRWGRWSDGGGSSLELMDARADRRLAPNWADSIESGKSQWVTVSNRGPVDLTHSGNPNADQLQIILLGPGECLVDDVEVFVNAGQNLIGNPGFEGGATGWFFQGTHSPTALETSGGFNSSRSLHIRATDRGDHVANRVRTVLTTPINAGQTATIRAKVRWLKGAPELLFRLKGNGLELAARLPIPANVGTPGAVNSTRVANAGPAIAEVSHRPLLPQAGQAFRVTARINDPDGVGSVILKYRLDPNTNLTSVLMTDNGLGADAIAGDGIFTGAVPGQIQGALIAFHVVATDGAVAPASAQFPVDAPTRECLVRVGESDPGGSFGTYRVWMTQASHTFWSQREKMSNQDVDATLIYGTNRVIYNIGAHYSGSSYTAPIYNTPTGNLCGYDLAVPPDDLFLGTDHLTLDWPIRDDTDQREQLMYWFLEQYGLPNMYRRYVNLYVNGFRRGTIYDDTQQPDGETLNEFFADDDGTLWKTDCWNEFDDAGNRIDPCILNSLEVFTSGGLKKAARYRWNWRPRAAETQLDFSDLFALVDAMNAPASGFVNAVESVADLEHWTRTFAMNDLASFWDAFGNPNAKNTYLYKPTNDRWKLLCWDFDVGLGVFNDPPDAALFPSLGDSSMNRFWGTPTFLRAYWRAMDEALNSWFRSGAGTSIDAVLDGKYAAFQAGGYSLASPAAIKTWISQRRTFLLAQLNTVRANFAVTSNGGTNFNSTSNLVIIVGTAPVTVRTIEINGVAWPVTWTTVSNWTARVVLDALGANTLVIRGLDTYGQPLTNTTRTISINYSGTPDAPEDSLVINEIMYHPVVPDAEFIEVFNRSTTTAFDLSGWRVNGVDFTFPDGVVLGPSGYLVVVKNRYAFWSAYGANAAMAGEYQGSLDQGGETLSLILSGATPAEDRLIDCVTFEDDPPWPASADGTGPSLKLIDPHQDNNRVSNWGEGSGWRFFTMTGTPGGTRFYLHLDRAGTALVDNVSVVTGTVAEVGVNLLRNGDFETAPLTNFWRTAGNHSNSTRNASAKYSGDFGLQIAATGAGSIAHAVYQDLPNFASNATHTVSFWYLGGTNASNLTARFSLNFRQITSLRTPPSTPGTNNATRATLPPFPLVWLNELQPHNVSGLADVAGERDPWVELYNSGTNEVNLAGWWLSDSYSNLTRWTFPADTVLAPGGFRLVWLDGQPGQTTPAELHTNFRLATNAGSLALVRPLGVQTQIVDYLNYRDPGADHSFGGYPDGDPKERRDFYYATPGGTNNNTAAPVVIWINEWMAANQNYLTNSDSQFDDWFELYNPGTNDVSLAGFTLTDNLSNPGKAVIPAGITVPARGFLLVWADEKSGLTSTNSDLHVNFKLAQAGEAIGLFDQGGRAIDTVTFLRQTNNVSHGRFPDGAPGPFVFMTTPTPRAANSYGCVSNVPVQVTLAATDGQTSATLTWTAELGCLYRVQFKSVLDEPAWNDLPGDVTATGSAASKLDDTLGGAVQRFYRILRVR